MANMAGQQVSANQMVQSAPTTQPAHLSPAEAQQSIGRSEPMSRQEERERTTSAIGGDNSAGAISEKNEQEHAQAPKASLASVSELLKIKEEWNKGIKGLKYKTIKI